MRRVFVFLAAMLAMAVGAMAMFAVLVMIPWKIVALLMTTVMFLGLTRVVGGWAIPQLTRSHTGGRARDGRTDTDLFPKLIPMLQRLTPKRLAAWVAMTAVTVGVYAAVGAGEIAVGMTPLFAIMTLSFATKPDEQR